MRLKSFVFLSEDEIAQNATPQKQCEYIARSIWGDDYYGIFQPKRGEYLVVDDFDELKGKYIVLLFPGDLSGVAGRFEIAGIIERNKFLERVQSFRGQKLFVTHSDTSRVRFST